MPSIKKGEAPKVVSSKELIRRQHALPITFYTLKDRMLAIAHKPTFLDALLVIVAFLAIVVGFPYYPLIYVILIMLALFVATLYHPFLGLIFLMVFTFPVLVYQMAAIAWLFLFIITLALVFGYVHYRTMLFSFIVLALSFSNLGYLLTIPAFTFGVLIIGRKRAVIMAIVLVLGIVAFSSLTGIQNTGYIVTNASSQHALLTQYYNSNIPKASVSNTLNNQSGSQSSIFKYITPIAPAMALLNLSIAIGNSTGKSIVGLRNVTTTQSTANVISNTSVLSFGTKFDQSLLNFGSTSVLSSVPAAIGLSIDSFSLNPIPYLIELAALIAIILFIDEYIASSRSRYKGTEASILAICYPISYLIISYVFSYNANTSIYLLISTAIAPILIYVLESNGINVARALDVRKQDIRMKFGETFEDLQAESKHESFNDIGNYDNVKIELKEAVTSPIEQRGISMAYNIKPVKGILFFGPPGTGKTMMMRALANEIHGAFYYVKTSEMISKFPGDTEKMISNVFTIAKKNQPCILFFDEIDSIAMGREENTDTTRRGALSTLLTEIDGFNTSDKIIVVGATNLPNVLDKALMRPGRFDKAIYMPLPNIDGRKKIFQLYLKKLPISNKIDINELAEKTERFSGADIRALCANAAREVAQDAVSKHKVLNITQADLLNMIATTKPSTSLSQIDQYQEFKIAFERTVHGEHESEPQKDTIKLSDVIGLLEVKKALLNAVSIPLLHPELVAKYKVKSIKGILLFGPPGNGKTMLMRATINDESMRGATMFEIRGAEIAAIGYERGSSTLKGIFEKAKENKPSIVFIDEIDSIAPSRSNASEEAVAMTTELLLEMDGITDTSGIMVVAATNRPNSLDPAILRSGRFDRLIFIKPPTTQEREELFKKYLIGVPIGDIDYAELSKQTKGFTAADITNICREAKGNAMENELKTGEESKIDMDMLKAIIYNTKPSAPASIMSEYLLFMSKYGQR